MLKGIDPLLSGELLKVLDELGHGDAISIVDRNYPAGSAGIPVIRVDDGITRVAEAVLTVFPLDADTSGIPRMRVGDDAAVVPSPLQRVRELARTAHASSIDFEAVERFAFYERVARTRAIILTREAEGYCNVILVKGVV